MQVFCFTAKPRSFDCALTRSAQDDREVRKKEAGLPASFRWFYLPQLCAGLVLTGAPCFSQEPA